PTRAARAQHGSNRFTASSGQGTGWQSGPSVKILRRSTREKVRAVPVVQTMPEPGGRDGGGPAAGLEDRPARADETKDCNVSRRTRHGAEARGCLGLGTERDRTDAGPPKVPNEDAMFPCLLLSAALIGQTAAPADTSASAAPTAPAPSPPADRWLLMKS